MDHPLNQASLDGLEEMDKILKGMAELDGDTTEHADASLEALRKGVKLEDLPEGLDDSVEKLIQAARNAREKKATPDITVAGQVVELVEAANDKLARGTRNSVRDALRTYDEVLASGATGEYLVPLLVNRAIALDALGECAQAAESARLAKDALPPDSAKRSELDTLAAAFDKAAALESPEVASFEGDAVTILRAVNAPPEPPSSSGAPFPPPPPLSEVPVEEHARRGPPLRFTKEDRVRACCAKDKGNTYLLEGAIQKAIGAYSDAILQDPDDAIPWSNRAVALLTLSKANDSFAARAAHDALKAVTCDPAWPRGYASLGQALLALGSPLEALEAFLDGARMAREGGRLEDSFELDKRARDARDAVVSGVRPTGCVMTCTRAQAQTETARLREALKSGAQDETLRSKNVTSRLAYYATSEAPRDRKVFEKLAQNTAVEVYAAHGLGLRVKRDAQRGEVLIEETALCVISLKDDACCMCAATLEGRHGGFCCEACARTFAARVPHGAERVRAHRQMLDAEGCVVGAGFHAVAAAQLFTVEGEDAVVLEALRRPGDLVLKERALVPFSDRHALAQDIDDLRHGPEGETLADAAYCKRRRATTSLDFGRVDALAGALEMNNLLVHSGEAVVVPRLACLANHSSTPSCEVFLGDQRRLEVVAVCDLAQGEAVTLDYCACSATVEHRRMVLGPFGLAHLAAVELVEDAEEAFPDFIPSNRRRVDGEPRDGASAATCEE